MRQLNTDGVPAGAVIHTAALLLGGATRSGGTCPQVTHAPSTNVSVHALANRIVLSYPAGLVTQKLATEGIIPCCMLPVVNLLSPRSPTTHYAAQPPGLACWPHQHRWKTHLRMVESREAVNSWPLVDAASASTPAQCCTTWQHASSHAHVEPSRIILMLLHTVFICIA